MTLRTFFWGAFWTIIGLVLIFHVAGGWYFSSELIEDGFVPDPDTLVTASGNYELEEVTYPTPLGQMDAWLLPASGATWVIHVHGKGPTPIEAEPLFVPLQEAGYPQLTITYRNDDQQPQDPTGYYRYGATEYTDVAGAFTYALENGAEEIVLNGYSTGAGHVMSFVFRQPVDRVAGILMDSPNVNFGDTVDFSASQRDLPILPFKVPPSLTAVSKVITSLRIGVNWKQIDYIERAAESLRHPTLIHHGTDDSRVPISQSRELAEAVPGTVQLIEVEGAGHVESYETDPEKYIADVLGFLDQLG